VRVVFISPSFLRRFIGGPRVRRTPSSRPARWRARS